MRLLVQVPLPHLAEGLAAPNGRAAGLREDVAMLSQLPCWVSMRLL